MWTWRTAAGVDLSRLEEAAVILAAGQMLAPGVSVEAADLAGTLRRLGYRETQAPPAAPGQFRREPDAWDLQLRPLDDPRVTRAALRVRVAVDGGRIRELATATGEPLAELELEPEILTGLGGAANQLRHPVPLSTVPRHLVQAVLAAEDHRFYEHPGVDLRAVGRAVWVNVRRGELAQGGQHAHAAAREEPRADAEAHLGAEAARGGAGHHARSRSARAAWPGLRVTTRTGTRARSPSVGRSSSR